MRIIHHNITYQRDSIQFDLQVTAAWSIKGNTGLSKYWSYLISKELCTQRLSRARVSFSWMPASFSWFPQPSQLPHAGETPILVTVGDVCCQRVALQSLHGLLVCICPEVCSFFFISIMQHAELYTDFVLCGCKGHLCFGNKTDITNVRLIQFPFDQTRFFFQPVIYSISAWLFIFMRRNKNRLEPL